ncbi:MAG TPA: hypothetical protein VJQ09_03965, partial [Candidatus Limnocylindria bacterium]|nr:hypothetical protein [Candidatus Limnocylindria bacterium]
MGRAGWGAIAALLLAAVSCTSAPPAKPSPSRDIPDARPLAREIADVLDTFAAYDYALVGSLNGERVRTVAPDRYAVVARALSGVIADDAPKIVAQAVDTAGPVHDRLVALADSLGDLRKDALAYADARQAEALARLLTDLDRSWALLRDLRGQLKDDATLDATIARGTAMRVTAAPSSGALVTVGPFA